MVCVLERALPLYLYTLKVSLGEVIHGNIPNRPPRALIAPLEEGGAERQCWGYGRTPGAAALGPAPFATAFAWQASGWA